MLYKNCECIKTINQQRNLYSIEVYIQKPCLQNSNDKYCKVVMSQLYRHHPCQRPKAQP